MKYCVVYDNNTSTLEIILRGDKKEDEDDSSDDSRQGRCFRARPEQQLVVIESESMDFITQSSESSQNVLLSLRWCPSPHSHRVTGRGPRKTYPHSGLYYRRTLSSGD